MKTSDIGKLLNLAARAREHGHILNLCLVSPPGLGKTEISRQWAKEAGYKAITVSCSTLEPPDAKGFPVTRADKDGNLRLSFAIPEMWPTDPNEKGVIILEELNRSPQSVMQCILSLTDARRGFDEYTLPPGYIVIANINPDISLYDTSTLDPALKDRFEMFPITFDKKSFLEYIRANTWDASIINFISADLWKYTTPEDIKEGSGMKYVANRTWSKVNAVLKSALPDAMEREVFEAILGRTIAAQFYSFRHDETPVMLSDLTTNLKKSLKKLEVWSEPKHYKSGLISLTVDDLIANAKDTSVDLVAKVVEVLPVEHSIHLVSEIERKTLNPSYLEELFKHAPHLKKVFKGVVGR